jgi:membrane-bound ClpP family serine protease
MALIITLLILGAVLMFLETVLPGMIAGIIGFVCLLAAVGFGYRDFGFTTGNVILGIVLAGLLVGFWCWLKFFPESRMAKNLFPKRRLGIWGWTARNS